jgi:hypothetical protein
VVVVVVISVLFIYFLLGKTASLMDIISKTHTVTRFLVVDLGTIFNTEFVVMCMNYLHAKFHRSN